MTKRNQGKHGHDRIAVTCGCYKRFTGGASLSITKGGDHHHDDPVFDDDDEMLSMSEVERVGTLRVHSRLPGRFVTDKCRGTVRESRL